MCWTSRPTALSAASAVTERTRCSSPLSGAVIGHGQSDRGGYPAGGECVQFTDDRLQTRYPKPGAEQAEDHCVVAGRASFVNPLRVVQHRRSPERRSGRAQQRPARPHRRLAGLPRELDRGEALIGVRHQFQIDQPVGAGGAVSAGECDAVRRRDPEADAVAEQCHQRRRAGGVSRPLWASASRPWERV